MTEAELNLELARLVYPDADHYRKEDCGRIIVLWNNGHLETVNYKDWSFLMPLVIEHQLDLFFEHGIWSSTSQLWTEDVKYFCLLEENTDPQLALVKCLIAVLKEKADE